MGMFDSIMFDCPGCGNELEIQSKAGDCLLDRFSSESVPLHIAQDICHEQTYCEKCDRWFRVKTDADLPTSIKMYLEDEK